MKKHNDIQQRSDEWHHIRKGKITGTTLKAIMGTAKARQDAVYEILSERLTKGIPDDSENAMDRGTRLEPEAIAAFEMETGLQVDQTGFCESDDNQFVAYSPDGLIAETDDSEDLEVKCPGGKNYVKMWITNEVPDEYYWQLIQAFVVNPKLKKRYFVGYNPDIPMHKLHIIEVTRESVQEDIDLAAQSQEVFLKEVDTLLKGIIKL